MMKIFLSLLLASAALAKPNQTRDIVPVEDCGSTAEIVSVEFDGCTAPPCTVHHGTHATGRITLKANSATSSLTCKLSGMLGGIELPFNGCPPNACESLSGGDCPTEEGEVIVYELDFEILKLYPTIDITAKWKLNLLFA